MGARYICTDLGVYSSKTVFIGVKGVTWTVTCDDVPTLELAKWPDVVF